MVVVLIIALLIGVPFVILCIGLCKISGKDSRARDWHDVVANDESLKRMHEEKKDGKEKDGDT